MTKTLRILIIDDEREFRELLKIILERKGYLVELSASGEEGLERIKEEDFDVVLTDMRMGGISGMEILKYIATMEPKGQGKPECIMITGYGSIENAVEAIRSGAFSYFIKSNNPEELLFEIDKIKKIKHLSHENEWLKEMQGIDGYVLSSNNVAFSGLIKSIEKVAATDASVLLLGESGVGKEVFARTIHRLSHRKNEVFMPVNCFSFSDALLEAELYGHEKGAFTGSSGMRIGRFEGADHGTLFLDEIGELPLATQIKILRNIEKKEIERIGSNKTIKTDFRLICATNKNMEQAIKDKVFREDLFYRINTVMLEIPPLRKRKEDLPMLIDYFLKQAERDLKKHVDGIHDCLLEVLMAYDYPGNIRELKNIIERLLVFSEGRIITLSDLDQNVILGDRNGGRPSGLGQGQGQGQGERTLREVRLRSESQHIAMILKECQGDMEKAAEILDISSRQLYNKINQFKSMGINTD